MEDQSREISCPCGHTYETDRTVNWCPKCGQKIFETEKERKANKMHNVYIYAMIGMVMATVAFFVFKLIIIPALAM